MSADAADGLARGRDGRVRCAWPGEDPGYLAYHDLEWGMPAADDRRLFEKICLEGFQSGLSWLTILRKRENFRRAFSGFDFEAVAAFGPAEISALLEDAGIVRHRGKIEATVSNARRACEMAGEFGSLAAFFWRWEPDPAARTAPGGHPPPSASPESTALSRELKRRGWTFVGPTTAYSFMQAMGLVNDHAAGCFARERVERARADFARPCRRTVSGPPRPPPRAGSR